MTRLDGWTPFRAAWLGAEMIVDWCHLGEKRFAEPFFYETISMVIGHPFNAAFRQRTLADDLAALPPGLAPSGFVFHMARCGSTLAAQALAADPAHIVMSEALPIRAMLQAPLYGSVAPERADAWLRGIVNALALPRGPGEIRFFVKFMAADVLDIGRIARVFPAVPWVFLYRDPLEILASQRRMGGADALPGAIPPERLELTIEEILAMPPEIYQLHVMAALGRAALAAGTAPPPGLGLVLRYDDLPEALWERLPRHFGFALDDAGRDVVQTVARLDAKAPARRFAPDTAAKRAAAAPWREEADRIMGPVMTGLDRARRFA